MATDLTGVRAFPHFTKLAGVLHTAMQEIQLPSAASTVTVGSTSAFRVAQNGATDGGAVPANYAFGVSNNYFQFNLPKGIEAAASIFVAGDSGAVDIYIVLEK